MALKKKLLTNNVEANYWRIVGFETSITGKMCQIYLIGYFNEVARLEKKNIVSKTYMIKPDKFDKYIFLDEANNYVSKLYTYLKECESDFIGATDILESEQLPIEPIK